MEQILAGLGSRVFLMNNVHEDAPTVFRSRWALSYLRGPVSRQQIEILMAPLKQTDPAPGGAAAGVVAAPRFAAPQVELPSQPARPVLPPGVPEYFLPVHTPITRVVYRPALLGQSRVHFIDARNGIDLWDPVTLIRLAADSVPPDPWMEADEWDEADLPEILSEPEFPDADYRDLPAELTQKKSYTGWTTALKNHLYRDRKLSVFTCEELKQTSTPGESEADFRIRLRLSAREERDRLIEKLRRKYAAKFSALDDKLRRAEQKIEVSKIFPDALDCGQLRDKHPGSLIRPQAGQCFQCHTCRICYQVRRRHRGRSRRSSCGRGTIRRFASRTRRTQFDRRIGSPANCRSFGYGFDEIRQP
jgi:hypothetical protein